MTPPRPVVATALVAIEVTGGDRVSHLDAVTTQRFLGVAPGSVRGWLVLDGKGGPLAVGWALVDEDRILLLAPPEAADHVLEVLAGRTFLADVTFTRLDLPVVSVAGDVPPGGVDVAEDAWVERDGMLLARHAFGVEVVGGEAADLVEAAEVVDGDVLGLVRGEPRWGHEVVPGRLPEEYGLLATHVHLAKGCYPGQEPIAHMWMLGRPRRQLVRLAPSDGAAGGADAADGGTPDAVEVEVTGRTETTALGFTRPGVPAGSVTVDDHVVAEVVGAAREVVGWTPAQTRKRDRGADQSLPGRRP